MADILEQTKFQTLTGITLTTAQAARYSDALATAVSQLELLLGWPLDPASWENSYIENGKSKNDCTCPDADTDTDPADTYDEGTYRLYAHNPRDRWMRIDPALEVQSIKIVRNGYTCKTLDLSKYQLKTENGNPTFIQLIDVGDPCNCYQNWSICGCSNQPKSDNQIYDIAVHATWAFETLPDVLLRVLAELVAYEYDLKKDVRSESVVSHSYSKNDPITPAERYADVLKRYAGPTGTVRRPRSVL